MMATASLSIVPVSHQTSHPASRLSVLTPGCLGQMRKVNWAIRALRGLGVRVVSVHSTGVHIDPTTAHKLPRSSRTVTRVSGVEVTDVVFCGVKVIWMKDSL